MEVTYVADVACDDWPLRPSTTQGRHRVSACKTYGVSSESDRGHGGPRWQYTILWRYGALLLVAVGLTTMGLAIAGVANTAVSVTLLPSAKKTHPIS
jgi:hypothetical protein